MEPKQIQASSKNIELLWKDIEAAVYRGLEHTTIHGSGLSAECTLTEPIAREAFRLTREDLKFHEMMMVTQLQRFLIEMFVPKFAEHSLALQKKALSGNGKDIPGLDQSIAAYFSSDTHFDKKVREEMIQKIEKDTQDAVSLLCEHHRMEIAFLVAFKEKDFPKARKLLTALWVLFGENQDLQQHVQLFNWDFGLSAWERGNIPRFLELVDEVKKLQKEQKANIDLDMESVMSHLLHIIGTRCVRKLSIGCNELLGPHRQEEIQNIFFERVGKAVWKYLMKECSVTQEDFFDTVREECVDAAKSIPKVYPVHRIQIIPDFF